MGAASMPKIGFKNINELRAFLAECQPTMTWRRIAEKEFKNRVAYGTLYRIAKDKSYEPKRPDIRRALGLPITASAPVCAKCGQVHVTKRCTQANGKTAKPRIRYKDLWLMMWAAYLSETKET